MSALRGDQLMSNGISKSYEDYEEYESLCNSLGITPITYTDTFDNWLIHFYKIQEYGK